MNYTYRNQHTAVYSMVGRIDSRLDKASEPLETLDWHSNYPEIMHNDFILFI